MLRWFRKYNKIILVIGCGVLMVAFLVPQALEQFSPRPGDRPVARVGGVAVLASELHDATIGLEVLERVGLRALAPYSREQWLMILKDARSLGLGASDVEVTQALGALGLSPAGDDVQRLAERLGQPPEAIRSTVRDLMVAERYRLLASGHRFDSSAATLSSSPGLVSIQLLSGARQQLESEQAQQFGPTFARFVEAQFASALTGTGRLSPPFVTAVLLDESERIGGSLAVVAPEVTDEDRAQVTEEDCRSLFTEYSGFLPGRGAPLPLGYRVPDQVELEWLSISASDVRNTVAVETIDVLEAFRSANPGATPTEQQREQTREQLLEQATLAKLREIQSRLRGELDAARRGVPLDDDGRLVLEGSAYRPPSLETLAETVAAAHGVRPTLERRSDPALSLEEAAALPELALAGLADLGLGFADLLRELPELRSEPPPSGLDGPGPVAAVAVQVGVPLPLLTDFSDGSLRLVRVTQARAAHEPAFEQVKDEVAADAALVHAYQRLLDRRAEFADQALEAGLESIAPGGDVVTIDAFPRRTRRNSPDGRPVPPSLPEIGRAPGLVDAVFESIAGLGPDQDVDTLLPQQRIVVEGVDGRMVLGVFRIETLERPTRSSLAREVGSGVLTGLDQTLLGSGDQNPLAEESLRERLGFVDEG